MKRLAATRPVVLDVQVDPEVRLAATHHLGSKELHVVGLIRPEWTERAEGLDKRSLGKHFTP